MRRALEFGPVFCLRQGGRWERDDWLYLANRFHRQHAGRKTGVLTTVAILTAERDKVVVRATDHFTEQPDRKQVALTWIEILRLENGKVVEAWIEADMGPILERLNEALAQK